MIRKALVLSFASIMLATSSIAMACDYKAGETKYLDYANCRYGEDAIQAVQLSESSNWEQCIFQLEAFRPPKLLAVTKEKNGKEILSINDRSKIGNPCYMTKQSCDAALKVLLEE